MTRVGEIDMDAVAAVIQEADAAEIAPRFRTLHAGDIEEKAPGEIVTVADRACEARLTAHLREIADLPVVGEEAASADPSLAAVLATADAAWLVDPLDGTTNFADGSFDYAVMVALVEQGRATASWMWHPTGGSMSMAARGAGATRNGVTVAMSMPRSGDAMRGVVKGRFLPPAVAQRVAHNRERFAGYDAGPNCAGVEYPSLVAGEVDFLLYWRTLPWDHAPGALFVEEAGGTVCRPDGEAYRCGSGGEGLLAAHADVIDDVRRRLLT
ncbi:MAG: inositol monophosphatase family protein [Acidimicrobiales bacterium]